MNGPLEKILKLCGKNKMRLNEVFEPVVKYPYAVLQCNGLLDEQDKVFSEENYSPRRRKLSEKKEEKENASTESITRESVFPYFVGFSFSIQLITFFILHAFETFSREFWDNKGTVYRNNQTGNNSLLRKQLCFWCLVFLKHKTKLQYFFLHEKEQEPKSCN